VERATVALLRDAGPRVAADGQPPELLRDALEDLRSSFEVSRMRLADLRARCAATRAAAQDLRARSLALRGM
jgi:hypothetical protein